MLGFLGHSYFPVLWMGNLAGLMSAASRGSVPKGRVEPRVKSLGERQRGTSSGAISLVVCCWEDQELATALERVELASLHLQPAVLHSICCRAGNTGVKPPPIYLLEETLVRACMWVHVC